MKHDDYVWVQLHRQTLLPIRIYGTAQAFADRESGDWVDSRPRAEAVAAIRHQIFVRSKGDCELCGSPITEQIGHMHEMQHRGKGGDISLANSVMACAKCHKHQHRDREPKFTRRQQ